MSAFDFINLILLPTLLVGISGICLLNAFTFHRLGRRPALPNSPSHPLTFDYAQRPTVSLLIPARNEAAVIGATVKALLNQRSPINHHLLPYEILILDDHSTDGTAQIAMAAAQTAAGTDMPQVRVIEGQDLPQGWGGKNWACHQLAQAALGDVLIFTDADVQWANGALSALLRHAEHTRADLLTVWPTQHTITWGERLVVPLMAFVVVGYLPSLAVHHLPFSVFAAGNGQCMLFRREAYQRVGGHAAVKGAIVEDIRLAQHTKSHGLRLRMADGAGLIACRMYTDWQEVRDGYAKNIRAGYGDSFIALGLATVFHWALFLWPWLWLLFGWLAPHPLYPLAPSLLIALGIGVRALSAVITQQRIGDALLLPISVLLMTRIAAQSAYWHWRYGGPRWKGRTITTLPTKDQP
jgi:chlorobactene glucosyltransferase